MFFFVRSMRLTFNKFAFIILLKYVNKKRKDQRLNTEVKDEVVTY
jgi:hypothetical protein